MNRANEILEVLMDIMKFNLNNYDLNTEIGQLNFSQDIMEALRESDLLNE